MNPFDPWEFLQYREVFPFSRSFAGNYGMPRIGYWLEAAIFIGIAGSVAYYLVDLFLRRRGFR